MAKRGNPDKVDAGLAAEAWRRAKGIRQATYSEYIRVRFGQTGSLDPGCDNCDLQAWLDGWLAGRES